jgi:hypothetical protein
MSRAVRRVIAAGVAAVLGLAAIVPPACAMKQFYAELGTKYVKPKSKERNDVALTIAFEQARCTICHPRDDKHKLTQYGGEVALRINKFDKGDKKKIHAALDEVGGLRSDPRDPKSPTYTELFRQGKLPRSPER